MHFELVLSSLHVSELVNCHLFPTVNNLVGFNFLHYIDDFLLVRGVVRVLCESGLLPTGNPNNHIGLVECVRVIDGDEQVR